jgi:homoserine O-acetyltransferase
LSQQQELADGIPGAGELRVVSSPYGHDAFLIETEQISPLVKELLV